MVSRIENGKTIVRLFDEGRTAHKERGSWGDRVTARMFGTRVSKRM
ncbi:hypothetical protein B005_1832 [Nocardiopsis alba ATCC BAA-2165]|uniref:Uncharacterized protein n=1 Tax=Nocardiopsis alba (strain ATCC BAA-2165 / BE74) TaxID=1205910 RepID=J7L8S1_NOCAA|nr:hypothetical protein B005_1832 [Nocardiopsis alba ATCC BAA-2165]